MKRIKGEQLYLFMGEGLSDIYPVGASTDCSISLSASFIEVSSRGAGSWRRFRPGKKEWSIKCGGFYFDQAGVPSSLPQGVAIIGRTVKVALSVMPAELMSAGINLESIKPNKPITVTGDAIVTACEYSGSVGGIATYTIALQGSGDLQQVL